MSPPSDSCRESCSEGDGRGAGGGREKNLPTNSGKMALLKSSLDFSTFSIQKSVSGYSLSMTMSLFVNTTKSQYVLPVQNN